MFLGDSFSITRTLVVGTLSYVFIVIILRVSGKRSLSQMSSFDFIVTVALGSMVGRILTARDLSLVDGLLGFGLLIFLQFLVTSLSIRSDSFSNLIKADPKFLYYDGHFDKQAMAKERILEVEVLQAVRSQGFSSLDEIAGVVLETDGTFSVIKERNDRENLEASTLKNVKKE